MIRSSIFSLNLTTWFLWKWSFTCLNDICGYLELILISIASFSARKWNSLSARLKC